jgi:hypothetical protein
MAHRLSPRARADIDDIAYYLLKAAVSKLLTACSNPFTAGSCYWASTRTLVDGEMTFVACAFFPQASTLSCTESRETMF